MIQASTRQTQLSSILRSQFDKFQYSYYHRIGIFVLVSMSVNYMNISSIRCLFAESEVFIVAVSLVEIDLTMKCATYTRHSQKALAAPHSIAAVIYPFHL